MNVRKAHVAQKWHTVKLQQNKNSTRGKLVTLDNANSIPPPAHTSQARTQLTTTWDFSNSNTSNADQDFFKNLSAHASNITAGSIAANTSKTYTGLLAKLEEILRHTPLKNIDVYNTVKTNDVVMIFTFLSQAKTQYLSDCGKIKYTAANSLKCALIKATCANRSSASVSQGWWCNDTWQQFWTGLKRNAYTDVKPKRFLDTNAVLDILLLTPHVTKWCLDTINTPTGLLIPKMKTPAFQQGYARTRTMVDFIFQTLYCRRAKEVRDLKLSHLLTADNKYKIHDPKCRKSQIDVHYFGNAYKETTLLKYFIHIQTHITKTDLLLTTQTGTPLSNDLQRKSITKLVSPHFPLEKGDVLSLRKTGATLYLNNGATDLGSSEELGIVSLGGWSSNNMLRTIYAASCNAHAEMKVYHNVTRILALRIAIRRILTAEQDGTLLTTDTAKTLIKDALQKGKNLDWACVPTQDLRSVREIMLNNDRFKAHMDAPTLASETRHRIDLRAQMGGEHFL